ncbi:hypothetical protein BTZ20_0714 [Rhodococcus sp. MTM3W5.2]|uniref:hypothetical protein n=1 Tax=Rhodococcus sp. MTM3W5.2 TaxID=1805827 RepID=UPI0009790536|nr:hypothetical protein [Rhodococcus sp. MTM3W5.2]AQA24797.1 hypothetical protein BTZ20_0714 [Rhodococcus sp. MTM3W5.2]
MGIQASSESGTPRGEEAIPAPLLRDYRHIGGIESIEIDGTRYFFGYDFSEDLVLSPLINDHELMSVFAETHMEQRDGLHDREYWRGLVDESLEYSALAEQESCSFEAEQLRLIITSLRNTAETGAPAPDFNYPYHLRFLLASAGQWKERFTATTEGIRSIKGTEGAAEGTTLEQIARDVLRETRNVMNAAGVTGHRSSTHSHNDITRYRSPTSKPPVDR